MSLLKRPDEAAPRQIRLGQHDLSYALKRSGRRSIGFSVSPEGLQVTAPWRTPIPQVEAAVRDKSDWILSKLALMRQRQAQRTVWQHGQSFPLLGQAVQLHLDPRRHFPHEHALQGSSKMTLYLNLPQNASEEQVCAQAKIWLKTRARRHFSAQLDAFAPQVGVQWRRLRLSSARTRWGSASSDGSIRLHWQLIHLPEDLIDYVIVHELAHLHEMNHSARFWQHVERVLPDFKKRRQSLRQHALSTF